MAQKEFPKLNLSLAFVELEIIHQTSRVRQQNDPVTINKTKKQPGETNYPLLGSVPVTGKYVII